MSSRSKQTGIHPPPKLNGGVAVEAEFVHCYKYSVVDLQIIMCITMHVTLVYPVYPLLFAFQPEHRLEASCLLTLLLWTWRWGEHCFVCREAIYERACTSLRRYFWSSGPRFDLLSDQFRSKGFFLGFSSTVRQMSGNLSHIRPRYHIAIISSKPYSFVVGRRRSLTLAALQGRRKIT